MPILVAIILAVAAWFAGPQNFPPQAEAAAVAEISPRVEAFVSLADQLMYLTVTDATGAQQSVVWHVSSGAPGYETPTGTWNPTWLSIDHKSATYDNAPMPFAVFFTGGYAVHATEYIGRLGEPASHGCIRLAPQNAEAFFRLVEAYGKANTTITVVA
jgi:lipoprotein-anchoring transpeptidase ErfK/SrfK